MASLRNTTSYVKFVRGTQSAWEALKAQNQVFNDTLYFIYENTGSSTGKLYLGTKQIGGGSDGEGATPVSLGELSDVILGADLANRDILVYNGTAWVNTTVEEILDLNENVFELDEYDGLTLAGFSAAMPGQIPQISSTGKLSWTSVSNLTEISSMKEDISNLKETAVTELKVSEMIAAADHLQYKIVESLESIKPEQIENPDSYIYLVPTGDLTGSNLYDEYMYIENSLEQVGKWDVNLSDYVTKAELTTTLSNYVTTTVFNDTVGALEEKVTALELSDATNKRNISDLMTFKDEVGDLSTLITYDNDYTLVEQVNELTERLTWQEILE